MPDEKTQEALIDQAHMEVGAHANARTMERELRRKYWWWNMREMCDEKVNSCEHCQRYASNSSMGLVFIESTVPAVDPRRMKFQDTTDKSTRRHHGVVVWRGGGC